MPQKWAIQTSRRKLILGPRYGKSLDPFGRWVTGDGTPAVPTHGPFYRTKRQAMEQCRWGEKPVRVTVKVCA